MSHEFRIDIFWIHMLKCNGDIIFGWNYNAVIPVIYEVLTSQHGRWFLLTQATATLDPLQGLSEYSCDINRNCSRIWFSDMFIFSKFVEQKLRPETNWMTFTWVGTKVSTYIGFMEFQCMCKRIPKYLFICIYIDIHLYYGFGVWDECRWSQTKVCKGTKNYSGKSAYGWTAPFSQYHVFMSLMPKLIWLRNGSSQICWVSIEICKIVLQSKHFQYHKMLTKHVFDS